VFVCAVCKENIGPYVKPIKVITSTREVSYHNEYFVEDEWGNKEKREVDSRGTEITGEILVCPTDAKEYYGIEQPPGNSVEHRGGRGFQEKLADPLQVKLIANVVHTALDRVRQKSKRAAQDSMVAVPLVKQFTDENKGLVF
jgi:hypothetical protein